MKDAVNLIAVGTFSEGDVGSNCYHTKLHSLILVLNHLLDGVEDRVVVDATAGVDTLSTSLMVAYDLKVFIVEPTLKSVSVFRDYLQLAPQWTNRVFVIGNKVHDGSDLTFLEETIGRERLLGAVPFLPTIRRIEQGSKDALDGALNELQPLFDKLDRKLLLVGRDWTEYLSTLRTIHAQNCQWWYNDFYGCSLEEGLDSSFSYQAITSKAI
jgi:CO dehydrogenase maturation factor